MSITEDNTSGSPQLNGREIPKTYPNAFAVPSDAKEIPYFPDLNRDKLFHFENSLYIPYFAHVVAQLFDIKVSTAFRIDLKVFSKEKSLGN